MLIFTHTIQTHLGYVIIPKPHFSSREGINSHCRRFALLLVAVLAQSVAAMTAVVAAHLVAVNAGRHTLAWDSVFAIVFGCFRV